MSQLTAAQLTTLKTELQTDPDALGYAALLVTTDVVSIAAVLNFIRDGVTPCPVNNIIGGGPASSGNPVNAAITTLANGLPVRNASIPTQTICGVIAAADLSTNQTAQFWSLWQVIMNDGAVQLTDANGVENNTAKTLKQALTNPSTSRTAVIALENRNGSRIEQILNIIGSTPGVLVRDVDVSASLNGHY